MTLYQRHVLRGQTSGPCLLIMAGIHGDEREPMTAVRQLADELAPLCFAGQVTLIPIANESACQRNSRVGEDQLDLARTFPGDLKGTLTQRLAAQLTKEILTADYLIDLHTGGAKLEILPMCGYLLHADSQILGTQRQMAKAFGLPYVWGTSASVEGRTLSVARDAQVPAIYAEFGGGVRYQYEAIAKYKMGCKRVMASLHMIREAENECRAQLHCEDSEMGSGHLQICHPAPCKGEFIAGVKLGERVQAGQRIGSVRALRSGKEYSVVADRSGVMLALYAQAEVERGTGLGVIVDFH